MGIDWLSLDWQSFATLATGGLAVIGAVVVGWRQLNITKRQNQILGRQTALAEITLKHDIFDRRFAVFEDTQKFLLYIISHAEHPPAEIRNAFISAMGMSRFLYPPQVFIALDAIWKTATKLICPEFGNERVIQA